MTSSTFPLRLQQSLLDELRMAAKREGVAVNTLINVAIAEKLEHLRAVKWFAERTSRSGAKFGERLLRDPSWGGHEPPRPGDEIPADLAQTQRPRRRHR